MSMSDFAPVIDRRDGTWTAVRVYRYPDGYPAFEIESFDTQEEAVSFVESSTPEKEGDSA